MHPLLLDVQVEIKTEKLDESIHEAIRLQALNE